MLRFETTHNDLFDTLFNVFEPDWEYYGSCIIGTLIDNTDVITIDSKKPETFKLLPETPSVQKMLKQWRELNYKP